MTGAELFDTVVNMLCLRESWYFALYYENTNGSRECVDIKKKV